VEFKVRAWTAAILAGAAIWGLQILQQSYDLCSQLGGRFGGLARTAIAGSTLLIMLLLVTVAAGWRRLSLRHFEGMVALLFAILVIGPSIGKTAGRLILGPDRMVLDSILQVEVASGMLVQGKNPYAESFLGTDLERWNQGADRPSLHHFVYPPLPLLVTLPLRELCLRTIGAYDSRFLLIPLLLATFLLAWKAWRGWEWRATALALAFLHPLVIHDFHVGRWDVLILFLWTFAVRAAMAGKRSPMAAWLAMAALTKTTMLVGALVGAIQSCRTRREAIRWGAVYAGVFLAVFLPFFLWNPREMVIDLFGATQGWGPKPFGISGGRFGFAVIVRFLGWVDSPAASFPFWIVQIPATLAVGAAAVRSQLRDRSLTAMAVTFASILGTYLYFNRICDAAWFGSLFSMVVLAVGYDRSASPPPENTSPKTAESGY
jgi:hypothetical protein